MGHYTTTRIMEELEQELEALRQENTLLQGLMTGGYAYFLHHFMIGHQSQMGLTSNACEQIVIDAIKRVYCRLRKDLTANT